MVKFTLQLTERVEPPAELPTFTIVVDPGFHHEQFDNRFDKPLLTRVGDVVQVKFHRPMKDSEILHISLRAAPYNPDSPNGAIMFATIGGLLEPCTWGLCSKPGRVTNLVEGQPIRLLCPEHWRRYTERPLTYAERQAHGRLKGCAIFQTVDHSMWSR